MSEFLPLMSCLNIQDCRPRIFVIRPVQLPVDADGSQYITLFDKFDNLDIVMSSGLRRCCRAGGGNPFCGEDFLPFFFQVELRKVDRIYIPLLHYFGKNRTHFEGASADK